MNLGGHFDILNKKEKVEELEEKTKDNNFWQDTENSTKVLQEIKSLKNSISNFEEIYNLLQDTFVLIELGNEVNDESVVSEVKSNVKTLGKRIDNLEVQSLLSGKHDSANSIITIHPGAGGTEAQDWAEMLYRMYSMWAEKNGYKLEELDYLDGDGAGVKSVTFCISGENSYGY